MRGLGGSVGFVGTSSSLANVDYVAMVRQESSDDNSTRLRQAEHRALVFGAYTVMTSESDEVETGVHTKLGKSKGWIANDERQRICIHGTRNEMKHFWETNNTVGLARPVLET